MNLMGISDPVTIVPSKPVIKPRPLRVRRFSKFWEFFTSIIQAMIREKFASGLTGSVAASLFESSERHLEFEIRTSHEYHFSETNRFDEMSGPESHDHVRLGGTQFRTGPGEGG